MVIPVRLAATAYCLPKTSVSVSEILERERARVDRALDQVTPALRQRVMSRLGIDRVRVCGDGETPYGLALAAARQALSEASVAGSEVGLIVHFGTLPGPRDLVSPLAHRLARDLDAETSLNLTLTYAGCGGLHLALKLACSMMDADDRLRVALLVAGDSAPRGSRSLLPVTVQGDAGSAVVLRRAVAGGPRLAATEVLTLGHLHDAIVFDGAGPTQWLEVDAARIENEVMPIYYLHFHRLVSSVLERAGVRRDDVRHVVYANVSGSDREGFVRSMAFDPARVWPGALAECGHTFASDLVINYTDLRRTGCVRSGDWLLFAAAGIGFTWGATLARA